MVDQYLTIYLLGGKQLFRSAVRNDFRYANKSVLYLVQYVCINVSRIKLSEENSVTQEVRQ